MPRRRVAIMVLSGLAVLAVGLLVPAVRREIGARLSRFTVEDRLRQIEPRVRSVWRSRGVEKAEGIGGVTLVALKHERELRVFVERDGSLQHAATFPIVAASGTAGPKLREGDRQVPEGFYGVSFLNPNSRFHLSLRVDYPNREDFDAATTDGRDAGTLGGDIMIHGGANSIGCVAVGDEPIEEVFWLVATVGIERTRVVFAAGSKPGDHLRPDAPAWLRDRSLRIESELRRLKIGG